MTIVSWGQAMWVAEQAANVLDEQGISSLVADLRSLVPLDDQGLIDIVAATGRCVVVHEAPLTGGFGAEIVARARGATTASGDGVSCQ